MRRLADGINVERLTLRFSSTEALREFADDADALRPGLPRVNAQSLALRGGTGLDELPLRPSWRTFRRRSGCDACSPSCGATKSWPGWRGWRRI